MKKKRIAAWVVVILWFPVDLIIMTLSDLLDRGLNYVDNEITKLWYKWNP